MDKSREQFEQWVINENKLRLSAHDNPLKRCAHSYYYGWVSSAWEVWQASRAAIEVELPELKMLKDYLSEIAMREREDILVGVRLEFLRKISAEGIKVKE